MVGSLIVLAVTYAVIASERIDKTIAAILGAAAVILIGAIPCEEALRYVDLNVLFLLIGMDIVVNIMWETGVFEWLAITIARISRGNGLLILAGFLSATALISSVLPNVTTVILMAPATILITQLLEMPTAPFLILLAVFSNIGGTATLVGDPPNILIGSQAHLTFNDFLINLAPIIVLIHLLILGAILLVFRKRLYVRASARGRVLEAYPRLAILDRPKLIKSLALFALIMLGFFFGGPLGIEAGPVALTGAVLMLAVCGDDVRSVMEKVDWSTSFFFVGLFMLIGSLDYNHVFERASGFVVRLTGDSLPVTLVVVLWFSALASALVDNIPLVMAMIPVIKALEPSFGQQMGLTQSPEMLGRLVSEPLFWALALGACLGGNGTLVGASANVVVTQIAKKNEYPVSFMGFTRYGFPIMVASLTVCTVYMLLRYWVFADTA